VRRLCCSGSDWRKPGHCGGGPSLGDSAVPGGRCGATRAWAVGDGSKTTGFYMAVCQNLVPLVNIKIAGKWMFIPLKMVFIGIDP